MSKVKAELVKAEGLVDDIEGIDWPLVNATLKCAAEVGKSKIRSIQLLGHHDLARGLESYVDWLDSLRANT